jgi:hypothetical protein
MITELTKISGTIATLVPRIAEGVVVARYVCAAWVWALNVLLMMVRTLAMRLMILALTLASGPAPNAGS